MLKKLLNNLGIILLVFVVFACSTDEQSNDNNTNDPIVDTNPPIAASVQLDVSYGEHAQQTYDLYLPANRSEANTKVIALVHGGGWTSGDKQDMNAFIELIQDQLPNHAIVNVNYVLATLDTPAFPNQFLDLKAVINQLTQQASSLKINPEFALIGTSAGAHLSLMYDYVYDTNDAVKMVCSIVGPTDFTDPFYSANPEFNFLLSQLIDESAYAADSNYTALVSPALQVSNNSAPTILFYGSTDPLVPITNGERLESALANVNVSHSFTIYEGGHGDNWSTADYSNLELNLVDYLQIYLPINEQ